MQRAESSGETALPMVSFIMPVLNAAGLLENCLQSIVAQNYPRSRYEILLADGGSKDGTQEIGRRFGAVVIDDRESRHMEDSKRVALSQAKGEFVVFVDADNELTHPDYVQLAVRALAANPQALGVESYYLPSPRMTSLCAFLTHHLHISDPLCWMMSVNPQLVAAEGEVERWKLPEGSCSYPLGANGFVYRRADIEAMRAKEAFQDTHIAMFLMQSGKREWLRIRGRGVHHYYVDTLMNFIRKRRRSMVHFLNVRAEFGCIWLEEKPPVPGWVACLYCATLVGPAYHTVAGLIRTGDVRWLWHVPASVASIAGAVWGYFTHKLHSGDRKLVSNLQPRQTLK